MGILRSCIGVGWKKSSELPRKGTNSLWTLPRKAAYCGAKSDKRVTIPNLHPNERVEIVKQLLKKWSTLVDRWWSNLANEWEAR